MSSEDSWAADVARLIEEKTELQNQVYEELGDNIVLAMRIEKLEAAIDVALFHLSEEYLCKCATQTECVSAVRNSLHGAVRGDK